MKINEVINKIDALERSIDDLYYTKRRLEKYKGFEFDIKLINEIGRKLTVEKSELEEKLNCITVTL